MKTLKIILGILFLSLCSMLLIEFNSNLDLRVSDPRWKWVREKIMHDPQENVDYAIIGSSRLWCSLKPNQMKEKLGQDLTIWNFGVNWYGREASYFIVKNLLEQKKVKNILVEFIESERHPDYLKPHQYSQYLISPTEVLAEGHFLLGSLNAQDILFYRSIFKQHVNLFFKYLSETAVRAPRLLTLQAFNQLDVLPKEEESIALNNLTNGFHENDSTFVPHRGFIRHFKKVNTNRPARLSGEKVKTGTRSDFYLKKINKLARKHNANVAFVYHPQFMRPLPSREMFKYYDLMGDVYLINWGKMYNLKYWRNESHLYQKGAIAFTDEVINIIENGKESSGYYKAYQEQDNYRKFF